MTAVCVRGPGWRDPCTFPAVALRFLFDKAERGGDEATALTDAEA